MDTPILDLASPPRYDHPPPFAFLGHDLPTYAHTAAADERVLISEPVASRATSVAPVEYVYETKRLRLNLGPKRWPIQVPCYGWNATIEGYVDVPGLARARAVRLTVTLEGHATSTVVERGMSLCTSAKTVLHTLNTVWSYPDPLPTETRFPFSFPLPSYMRSTDTPLPPSYATVMPGLAAECRYTIRVDMYRKGLRRHETIKAVIFYLPRTTPPAPPIPRYPSPPSSPIDEADRIKWKTIEMSPIAEGSPATDKEDESIPHPSETVDPMSIIKLTLPEPLVYASASTIPFTLKIRADSPVVPRLFNHLDVYIIKKTVIFSGAYFGVREGVIGTAELHQVEDEPPENTAKEDGAVGWKVFRGSVTSVREGGETSWAVPGLLSMKYYIGIRIEPSTTDPTRYFHKEPIKMVTHPRLPHDRYIHDPVLGLIAVPGSSGRPI